MYRNCKEVIILLSHVYSDYTEFIQEPWLHILRKDVYHVCSTNFRILLTSLVSRFETEHRIESVQRYFTRRILRTTSYLERSNFLKLEILERWIKADLVMHFKFMNNFTEFFLQMICLDILVPEEVMIGSSLCFTHVPRSVWLSFIGPKRSVSNWNRLPQVIVNNASVYGFKRSLRIVNFIGTPRSYCFN